MIPADLIDKRVLIKPISQLGTVVSHHRDECENPIIVVIRDSDGEHHCCRMCELEVQHDQVALFQQYCEVLAALETLVPVMQNTLLHQGKYMLPGDYHSRKAILKMCEETLEKYRVKDEVLETVEG